MVKVRVRVRFRVRVIGLNMQIVPVGEVELGRGLRILA